MEKEFVAPRLPGAGHSNPKATHWRPKIPSPPPPACEIARAGGAWNSCDRCLGPAIHTRLALTGSRTWRLPCTLGEGTPRVPQAVFLPAESCSPVRERRCEKRAELACLVERPGLRTASFPPPVPPASFLLLPWVTWVCFAGTPCAVGKMVFKDTPLLS